MNDWSAKLEAILKNLGINKKQLAERTDVNTSYISALTHGQSKNPSTAFIQRLCRLGVSAEWLINGRGSVLYSDGSPEEPHSETIPILSSNDILSVADEIRRRHYSGDIEAVRVTGDAMLPTFSNGDIILIIKELIDGDGIYAINDGMAINIRRLQFERSDNKVLILADSPHYQPRTLLLDRLNDSLRIEGKAVCRICF